MKARWTFQRLDEACTFTNGLWKGQKPPFVNVGVYRNTNFGADGSLDHSDVAYLDVELKQLEKRKLQIGDIILEKSGGGPKQPVGRVALFERDDGAFSFSNFTSVLRVNDPRQLDYRFLMWFLHNIYVSGQTAAMQTNATGIRNLDTDTYKAIEVPLPPLPEQRRIVAILDEAFEGIAKATANAQKNIENARAMFESHLDAVFSGEAPGWGIHPIEEHVRFIDYRGRTPEKTPSGLRLITAKNVRMGFLREEPAEYIAPESYDNWMTRGIPKKGDVLFTTEAPLANVAQLDTDERVAFAQRVIIMQAEPRYLDSTFLKYALMSPPVQRRIQEKATGATALGIKASLLKKIPISYPTSLPEQKTVTNRCQSLEEQCDALEANIQQKLAALDELKKSLLHHAFTGEL